jgi:hypothetical protein
MILHLPRLGRVLRVAGTAAGVALATVGLMAQPAAALGGVMVGVFVAGGTVLRLYDRPGIDVPARRRVVIGASGTAVWLWLVGAGLVVLLGTSTASVLVALVVVGGPAALLVRRGFRPVEPVALALPLSAEVRPLVLATLSTPELCLAWRRSYIALGDLPAGPARGELVALRQSMLDELERRDPAGFHRWLDAGARAGGDPGRYLATGPGA